MHDRGECECMTEALYDAQRISCVWFNSFIAVQ